MIYLIIFFCIKPVSSKAKAKLLQAAAFQRPSSFTKYSFLQPALTCRSSFQSWLKPLLRRIQSSSHFIPTPPATPTDRPKEYQSSDCNCFCRRGAKPTSHDQDYRADTVGAAVLDVLTGWLDHWYIPTSVLLLVFGFYGIKAINNQKTKYSLTHTICLWVLHKPQPIWGNVPSNLMF